MTDSELLLLERAHGDDDDGFCSAGRNYCGVTASYPCNVRRVVDEQLWRWGIPVPAAVWPGGEREQPGPIHCGRSLGEDAALAGIG
jgi:hypothetical protein